MPHLRILIVTRAPTSDDEMTRLTALRNGIASIADRQRTGRIISFATLQTCVECLVEIDDMWVIVNEVVPLLREQEFTDGVYLFYRDGATFEQVLYP